MSIPAPTIVDGSIPVLPAVAVSGTVCGVSCVPGDMVGLPSLTIVVTALSPDLRSDGTAPTVIRRAAEPPSQPLRRAPTTPSTPLRRSASSVPSVIRRVD